MTGETIKTKKSKSVEWSRLKSLVRILIHSDQWRIGAIIAAEMYMALRISDIKRLTFNDVLTGERVVLSEKKTGKTRKIPINPSLKQVYQDIVRTHNVDRKQPVCQNRFGGILSTQYINRKLKEVFVRNGLSYHGISTHSFRKSMCREIWKNDNYSEKALIMISDMLNHTSVKTTKIYLDISDEEIDSLYLSVK